MNLLREYIAYARAKCTPELTDEAAAALVEGYIAMRKQGISRKVCTPARTHCEAECAVGMVRAQR